jgi:hypothetical protein
LYLFTEASAGDLASVNKYKSRITNVRLYQDR